MSFSFLKSDFFQKEKSSIISVSLIVLTLILIPFTIPNSDASIQILLQGLILSSIYLTTSIGFSLIFGVAKQFKLSLGAYYVIGAYSMIFLQNAILISPKIASDNLLVSSFLLLILFIPLILTILVSVLVLRYFEQDLINKLLLIISPFVTLFGIFVISRSYTYSFFSGLAITCILGAGWYLEFNKKVFPTIIFIISLLEPLLFFSFDKIFHISSFIVIFLNLVVVGTFFSAIFAMLSDRYLLEKVRYSAVNVMIVTFALAITIQGFIQLMFYPVNGTNFKPFGVGNQNIATILPKSQIFFEGIPTIKIISSLIFIFVLILLFLFINYSRIGLAIKAVSQDETASSLAGINIRKVTAIVSGIGMGLVGLASILTSSFSAYPIFSPSMGWTILIFAIVIVTLGGMGSLLGTVIASLIFGMTTVIISSNFAYSLNIPFIGTIFSVTIDSTYSVLVPLIIVLIVMIIRPHGLFGKKEEQT